MGLLLDCSFLSTVELRTAVPPIQTSMSCWCLGLWVRRNKWEQERRAGRSERGERWILKGSMRFSGGRKEIWESPWRGCWKGRGKQAETQIDPSFFKKNKTKATLHLLLPREKLEQQSEGTERGGSSSLSISSVRQVAQAGSQWDNQRRGFQRDSMSVHHDQRGQFALGAQTRPLPWRLVFFLIIFLFIFIVRVVHQTNQSSLRQQQEWLFHFNMYFCRSAGQLLVLKHSVLNFTHILLILTSEVKQQVTCVTFICIHVVIPLETYCATQKTSGLWLKTVLCYTVPKLDKGLG